MADRWYYTHAGQTLGPATAAQLRQLALAGQLGPTDLIWPEGKDHTQAVPAQTAVDFSPAAPSKAAPDWLSDLRAAEDEKPAAAPAPSDWLDDVRQAEQAEQEMFAAPWDGEAAAAPVDDDERVMELLDELEGVTREKKAAPAAAGPSAPTVRLVLGSATTRGRVRDRNEDSLLVQQCTWSSLDRMHEIALIVIADGMGGHQAGDRASALVVRALGGAVMPLVADVLSGKSVSADLAETLDRGMLEANRLVREKAQQDADCKGMGSTAVALLLWDGQVYISLVGDCRVYHASGGRLTQVTRDQTLVARMVELGQLTPEEAAKHPRRHEVSQAIGKYALLEPARYELTLGKGDWLVACCDGLYAHVTDRMMQEVIAKAGTSAAGLANRLIELANQGGGSDNCTVVAVHGL